MLLTDDYTKLEAATFDHVNPRSLGGSDNQCNLRLAHQGCNNQRGNGGIRGPTFIVEPAVGPPAKAVPFSREWLKGRGDLFGTQRGIGNARSDD